jgi:hypothetical protein
MNQQPADLILHNGKIATQDDRRSLGARPRIPQERGNRANKTGT